MTNKFIHDLKYEKTEWGSLYLNYKDLNQGQLQKSLLKIKNERKEWLKVYKSGNTHELIKVVQHIFYMTEYDDKLEQYFTPKCLLKSGINSITRNECISAKWSNEITELRKLAKIIFTEFWKRQKIEQLAVEVFYNNRKKVLEIEQKQQHNTHAKEEVKCPCCKASIARTNLSRHLKTNKKCLIIKVNGINIMSETNV